jgi:hypothetical protein
MTSVAPAAERIYLGMDVSRDKEAYAKLPVKMIKQVCDLR